MDSLVILNDGIDEFPDKGIDERGEMKMKTLLALAIGFVFVGVGSISAQTETGIFYKRHTFELGPEISYRTYK